MRFASRSEVRQAALARIDDQRLLVNLVRDGLPEARDGALARLTDQAMLGEIAKGHAYVPVRVAAVEKLTDQAMAGLAAAEGDHSVRLNALRRLTDQAALARIGHC